MKIAIYNPYNFEIPGGVLDHVTAQSHELRRRGHDVTILTPRPRKYSGETPPDMIFTGVSARIKAQSSQVDISSVMDSIETDTLWHEHQFDVVHFHEPTVPFAARQLIASCPYPVVATLHAALPDTAIGKTLGSIKPYFRGILQHVDILTRVSVAAGQYLEEEIDHADAVFIPNGLELKKFRKGSAENRMDATIFYVGRLEKRKGPRYLLQAFAILKKRIPHATLVLASDGPDRQKLEDFVREYHLHDVTFLGFVDEDVKRDYLKRATVACYPALYGESFGVVLLEAMASGVPIVAGNNPGYETVLTGRGALGLVNPTDTVALANRLQLFLEDAGLRQMLSAWGLQHVKQFDYTHIVDSYEAVYKRAIEKHRKAVR
jgi:phosphatidylinositol alpha-mannosyltransferase